MAKNKCAGKNRAGEPCGANPLKEPDAEGRYWCSAHSPEVSDSERFGHGDQQRHASRLGGEALKRPRVVDLLREKLEEDLEEEVLQVFKEAVTAKKAVVVRDAEGNERVEFVTDHETRMRAADRLFDRAYGKPKQVTELTGADGGPLEIEAPVDALDRSTQAAALLARAGLIQGVEGNGKALNGSNGNGNGHA